MCTGRDSFNVYHCWIVYLWYVQGQTLQTVLDIGHVPGQTSQIEMLCISQSQIWGMYRDRHYSNICNVFQLSSL